jgi:hypothetical protein
MPNFYWTAKLRDGSVVSQAEGALFQKDIVPKAGEIVALFLTDGTKKRYGVNLETGDFLFSQGYLSGLGVACGVHPDLESSFAELLNKARLCHVRPIFFRRTEQDMTLAGELVGPPRYVYAIGWQATVKIPVALPRDKRWHMEDRNVKRILYVYPDGRCVLA